jgi:ribosomal protein S27E
MQQLKKVRVKCPQCHKIKREDALLRLTGLCGDCGNKNREINHARAVKLGRCRECGMKVKDMDEADKDMFDWLSVCGSCFFKFEESKPKS